MKASQWMESGENERVKYWRKKEWEGDKWRAREKERKGEKTRCNQLYSRVTKCGWFAWLLRKAVCGGLHQQTSRFSPACLRMRFLVEELVLQQALRRDYSTFAANCYARYVLESFIPSTPRSPSVMFSVTRNRQHLSYPRSWIWRPGPWPWCWLVRKWQNVNHVQQECLLWYSVPSLQRNPLAESTKPLLNVHYKPTLYRAFFNLGNPSRRADDIFAA